MAESAPQSTEETTVGRSSRWLPWLVLFLVATAAASLAAVHLPARVKLLGLLAIAYGLLTGWIAARLGSVFDLPRAPGTRWSVVVFLIVLAGQVGLTVESQRIDRRIQERAIAADSKRAAVLRMLESARPPDDPQSKQTIEEMRRTVGVRDASFADYLRFRVTPLGIESRRGAFAFWCLELGLGSAAAVWVFRRLTMSAGSIKCQSDRQETG